MICRGTMQAPQTRVVRYVYVEMLADQVDVEEGKLRKGDVVVIPEDKATRWVYRARIAKPSDRDTYERFVAERMRQRGATNPRPRYMNIPDEPAFEYVDESTPEWGDARAKSDEEHRRLVSQGGGDPTLADQFSQMDDADYDPDDRGEQQNEPGVYDQAIDRGPGEGRSPRPRLRGRRGAGSDNE